MYRRRGLQHEVAFDSVRPCGECHAALCYEHILENHGIHCTELWWQDITEDPNNFKYTQWHQKHTAQTRSTQEAFNIVKPGVEARVGWAQYFARLAWKYRDCRPISDHVRVGWYDPMILNANKPKVGYSIFSSVHIISALIYSLACKHARPGIRALN